MKKKKHGIAMASLLILTAILVIMTISMVFISTNFLALFGNISSKDKALKAADAGIEYSINEFNKNPQWGVKDVVFPSDPNLSISFNSDSSVKKTIDVGDSKCTITFDQTEKYYSVNNLYGSSPSGDTPAYTAKILAVGQAGSMRKVIQAFLIRSDVYPYTANSDGRIVLNAGKFYIMGPGNVTTKPPGDIYSGWKSTPMPDNYSVAAGADVTGVICEGGMFISKGPIKLPESMAIPFDGYNKSNIPQSVYLSKIDIPQMIKNASASSIGSPVIQPGQVTVKDNFVENEGYNESYLEIIDGGTGFANVVDKSGDETFKLKRDIYIGGNQAQVNNDRYTDIVALSKSSGNVFRINRNADLQSSSVGTNVQTGVDENGLPVYGLQLTDKDSIAWNVKLDLNGHTIYSDSHLILGVEIIGSGRIISNGKVNCILGINKSTSSKKNQVDIISEDDLVLEVSDLAANCINQGLYYSADDIYTHPMPDDSLLRGISSSGGTGSEKLTQEYAPGVKLHTPGTPPTNATGVGYYDPPDPKDQERWWRKDYTGNGLLVRKVVPPTGVSYKLEIEGAYGSDLQFCLEYDGFKQIDLGKNKIILTPGGSGFSATIQDLSGNPVDISSFPALDQDKLDIFGNQIASTFTSIQPKYNITLKSTFVALNRYKNTNPLHDENQSVLDTGSRDGTFTIVQNIDYMKVLSVLEKDTFKVRKLATYEVD